MHKLHEIVERKFIESYELDDYEVLTDSGFQPITYLHKTVKYVIWELTTDNYFLECADTHIVFDPDYNEVFVKDLIPDHSIILTKTGPEIVRSVKSSDCEEHMFDLSINSNDHRFYTDGILSHNSITTAAYILWYVFFHSDRTVYILANKAATAREILARVKAAYERTPFFLQPGASVWNKGSIELGNASKIVAAATTSDSIRGQTANCVTGDTHVCLYDDKTDSVYYTEISNILNKSEFIEVEENVMYYLVYKTTNQINGKIYIGYHQTKNLNDGYLGSGKLIKKAIEKYGPSAFKKEILGIFSTQEEAEKMEATLVDEEFTLRDDTYNLCLGGNVRIMCGKNNPFYGKTHTLETRKILSETNLGRKRLVKKEGLQIEIDGTTYKSIRDASRTLGITSRKVILKAGDPDTNDHFFDIYQQEKATKLFLERLRKLKINKQNHKERLRKPMSDEQKQKIRLANKGKSKSIEQVIRVNKDPIKIAKTAEKHRGMKRSTETKIKMSLAKKGKTAFGKGKVYCYHPETLETQLCFVNEIPEGWNRGFIPKCKY
jgi:hypothetical protein